MIYERDVLILNDEQKILEKAFNWWVKNDVIYGRNIKSLYLYPRAGHTTLWKMLREERLDIILISETLELGKHNKFVDKFSTKSNVSSFRMKVRNKIVIIDSGGFSVNKYERFIKNVLDCRAKGVLVS